MLGEIIDQSVKESKVDLFISLTIEKLEAIRDIYLWEEDNEIDNHSWKIAIINKALIKKKY